MADDSNADVPSQEPSASFGEAIGRLKPPTSWVLPLITAVVLASVFCLYYFVYVQARREYLANRNFRSLAMLGDQVQAMVTMHSSILEFSAHLADPARDDDHRKKEDLEKFVVIRPEDESNPSKKERDAEALKDYLKYLAPGFALTNQGRAGQSRLEVQRRNGRWELVLTAHKHKPSQKDYVGSLELSQMLEPLVGSLPFDDILLVSKDGTIVYQSHKAGPQFTTLTGLLQAQPEAAEAKPEAAASEQSKPQTDKHSKKDVAQKTSGHESVGQNTDKTWQISSKHLTDIQLAGTRYKLFLQPLVLDVYSDQDEGQDEPAQEWVLCGLRSAKTLEWEALSISSTFMVWITAFFLAIFMSSPLLKVLFMNHRQHLRLREIGWLSSSLVLLAIVFTLSGLNAIGFPLNDDTEKQLENLGRNLSNNIHDDLKLMREQLVDWCKLPATTEDKSRISLQEDLRSYEKTEHKVVRSYDPNFRKHQISKLQSPSDAGSYFYLNNVFWTDDDGQQIVKWGASRYLTPMIDISQYRLFKHPQLIYLDQKGPPFHFDSVIPTSKVEYLAALAIKTEDCNRGLLLLKAFRRRSDLTGGIAVLTAQPLSLIDPILPYGYGFALLDDKGVVLFHSDKTKNLHENFLQETDWNQQLQAAMFGHSNQRSLLITYMGRDYQARVIPIPGVSQAPWSLIVYRDLASVRTLNLQAIIMAATLLLLICVLPAAAVAMWALILRPRFAPEWLWPNHARMLTYVYQIAVYALLIVLFLFLGFTGSSEQNLVACVAIPYTAFLLTVWSIRAYAPGREKAPAQKEKAPAQKERRSYSWLIVISIVGAAGFVLIWRTHLPAFTSLVAVGTVAIVPLLDPLRRDLTITSKRYFRQSTAGKKSRGQDLNIYGYRGGYILSVVMLLLLVGVLVPAALFRTSLNIERGLTIKQAQLHLASALDQRGELRLAEAIREGRSVLILVPHVPENWRLDPDKKPPLDLEEDATQPKWAENLDLDKQPVNTVIEILHFEYGLNDPKHDEQKKILIRRLLERENTQLAAVMKVPPSPDEYDMFRPLEVIDLREEPLHWKNLYKGPAEDLIWKECGPMPALWPIGAQLAKDIKMEETHSEETIASEILERADGYYRLVWKECSDDQKFVLAQLAEDGLVNPTNARAIRQLVRRGLITTDPQFRLMNESFRRFVESATSAGLKQEWLRESRRSGWGKMHGVFFTTMILLGAFLLTTQNALWQSSAAYVTTALGALGTLFKLFNTYRGGGTTEKAG